MFQIQQISRNDIMREPVNTRYQRMARLRRLIYNAIHAEITEDNPERAWAEVVGYIVPVNVADNWYLREHIRHARLIVDQAVADYWFPGITTSDPFAVDFPDMTGITLAR